MEYMGVQHKWLCTQNWQGYRQEYHLLPSHGISKASIAWILGRNGWKWERYSSEDGSLAEYGYAASYDEATAIVEAKLKHIEEREG